MPKQFHKNEDPHRGREAERYEHPVPSREYIINYIKSRNRPVSFTRLMKEFDLKTAEEKEGLRRRIKAMQRDGQVMSNRRGSYALVAEMELLRGRVQGHRDGYGFFIPDNGSDDVFLSAREMRSVFTDDIVLARISSNRNAKREGVIIEILERNTHQVVGRYVEEQGIAFVDPDNKSITQDIVIPPGKQKDAKHGQFVVVQITAQPTRRRQPLGEVISVLGDILTPGMEIELAIRSYDIPVKWPNAVKEELHTFDSAVTIADKKNRENYCHLPFVTIDGEDAKDFDDAVYCEANSNGWKLYVAIADVSHYVTPSSNLDKEAELRGNSVYFPAKVIPMLPEQLSNGLCSLKPNQDRLVVVCIMNIDKSGCVTDFQFKDAMIHSHARLTYTEVSKILSGEKTSNAHFYKHLKSLHLVYKKLAEQREYRGAIEFETLETKIEFDQKGKIKRIIPLIRNDAHRIIEECMLAANVCAAGFLMNSNLPTLYRSHESPKAEKLLALRDFLKAFGLRLTGGKKPETSDYAKLLSRIEKRPDAHLLQTVILRSMQQANYTPENVGHFGLSYESYTHFTSPIRRYPDLLIHRAIKYLIYKKPIKKFNYSLEDIRHMGEHCSTTERRADRASRDATDWLKCEFMLNKVGQAFNGHIVDVTGFGVFVELDDIYVQGLVHITSLKNDYYHHDATHHLLRGKRSSQTYRLGDAMRVTVAKVNLDDRKIDFDLAE